MVGVVNVPELMAPDFAIVRLRNGVCLLVGDEGVNVCNTEADMKAGIVSDGLTFQRHSAESPTEKMSHSAGSGASETEKGK